MTGNRESGREGIDSVGLTDPLCVAQGSTAGGAQVALLLGGHVAATFGILRAEFGRGHIEGLSRGQSRR